MKRMIIDYDFMIKHGTFNACMKAWFGANLDKKWKRLNANKISDEMNSSKRRVLNAINLLIEEGYIERNLTPMRANGLGTALGMVSSYRLKEE